MVDENAPLWSEAEFRQIMEDYLGLHTYHILGNTEDFGIQHIDCWAKLLDEETILVKQAPTWHGEYSRIEANVAVLEGLTNSFGRPYTILRIDCPPYAGGELAAYTNSLILNQKVLVPLFGIAGDSDALATYEEYMPGYEIIGVPYGAWYYYDALHCRTRAIYDRHMLRIVHRPLDPVVAPGAPLLTTAEIDDRSEAGLLPDQLWVYWREATTSEWTPTPLTPSGSGDIFDAFIPDHPVGTVIEYYLSAADASGRTETLLHVAPGDAFSFTIGAASGVPGEPGTQLASNESLRIVSANPFQRSVHFKIERARPYLAGAKQIWILDSSGRLIRTLAASRSERIAWDTRDANGVRVSSGVYWAVLQGSQVRAPGASSLTAGREHSSSLAQKLVLVR